MFCFPAETNRPHRAHPILYGKMHAFHVVWVLTNGGPLHFSETIATYVQKASFGWNTFDLATLPPSPSSGLASP
jgi:hypothetical protein